MTVPAGATALQGAFAQAVALHRAGRLADAAQALAAIAAARPDYFDALHLAAVVAAQQRRFDEALRWFDRALAIDPEAVEANANRAGVCNAMRRFDAALADAERALARDPRHVVASYQRALALQQLGRLEEALAGYALALEFQPEFVPALVNRAAALLDFGRPEEAVETLERALASEPGNAAAHYHRGLALQRLARFEDALQSYVRALDFRPAFPEALNNQGVSLQGLHRYEEAIMRYDGALALKPDFGEALYNRAIALSSLGRHPEAANGVQRALALEPDMPYARGVMLHSRMHCGDWRDHDAEVARIVGEVRSGRRSVEPLPFIGVSDSPPDQQACAAIWVRDRLPQRPSPGGTRRYRHDRIRIAYLSADFHDHATAHLAAGLFERHDRTRFETTAVVFGPNVEDAMSARLARAFDRWHDVRGASDAEAARLIERLEIDIAVDLKGYTDDARPEILAYRPAPVQVSFLGYPGTMAAEHIDYLVADACVIPCENQPCYSEQIVYLPDSYQVNDGTRPIAERTPTRAEVGLPDRGFVFCAFNNTWKITPRRFGAWMELLRQVDGSVLWLLAGHPAVPANLRREATVRDVDAERLVFAPRIDLARHLARHRLADLFLDTLPCNAHTTASDALWAGLPVLTVPGAAFAGRVAASLLHAVGLAELVAPTEDAYLERAIELAADPVRLAALREQLGRNRRTHPLFDADRYVCHLEDAYVAMWERQQRGERPASFAVSPRDRIGETGAAGRVRGPPRDAAPD